MGQGYFSLRVDPKAGEWKHEIGLRMAYLMGFGFVLNLIDTYLLPRTSLGFLIHFGLIVAWFALPEMLLRRSSRVGVVTFATCFIALISVYLIETNLPTPGLTSAQLLLVSLGGALGFSAGYGARNLLATVLGLMFGPAIGFLTGLLLKVIPVELEDSFWVFVICVLLPCAAFSLSIGLAVWLGVKLSRRGQPNPPGAQQPASV